MEWNINCMNFIYLFFSNFEYANESPFIVYIPQIRSTMKIDIKSSQWFFFMMQARHSDKRHIFVFVILFLFKWQSTLSMLNSNEDYQYVPWGQKRLSQCFTNKQKKNNETVRIKTDESKTVFCNAFLGCKLINVGWLNFFSRSKFC